ncbi:MAG TPA: SH3 domain-containing protein [Anaerolineae bacterium]|nr:SH3 domain-containing protein [Anaerolineae bacterium]
MRNSLFKRLLLSILVIVLALPIAACPSITPGSTTTTTSTTSTTTQPAIQACGGEKLPAVDEAAENPDFKEFRDQLLAAVRRKDVDFLKEHLDENIRGSFGSEGNGIDSFMQMWGLTTDPEKSKLWLELGEVMRLGGTFTDQTKTEFTAPYVYSNWPEKYDAFTYAAIIANNVNLRSAPNTNSSVVCRLNHNIVKLTSPAINKSGWNQVQTTSGTSGYILGTYVRSSVDYRARFKKEDDVWKMVFFIAGD